jgi:hypothetical protein
VPADFVWPAHERAAYRFLGQINFADIDSPPTLLPASGLLSLFYAAPHEGAVAEDDFDELDEAEWDALEEAKNDDIFWREPGFVIAFYWPTFEGFALRSGVTKWRASEDFPLRRLAIRESENTAIHLASGVDLPGSLELRKDWPFDKQSAYSLFDSVRALDQGSGDHLLGYPSFSTLGYDPTPGEHWLPLISVRSILDWCWHDGDWLMVFIEKDKLAKQDFGCLRCDAG